MRRALVLFLALAVTVCAGPAPAASTYGNARYGFTVAIPPGFSSVVESQSGDGGTARSRTADAQLDVWGALITEGSFADEVAFRRQSDAEEGWHLSYERSGPDFAVWSGTRAGRVLYERAITGCAEEAVYFRLEYDAAGKAAMDAAVRSLTRSLRSPADCR